jgi:UDP-N-acetylmuramate--alanine ligase
LGCLLEEGHKDPLVVSGGIVNAWGNTIRWGQGPWAVVEADESDRSMVNFAQLKGAVISNVEPEHMENYGHCVKELEKTFRKFLNLVPRDGVVIVCGDDPGVQRILDHSHSPSHAITYGYGKDSGPALGRSLRAASKDIAILSHRSNRQHGPVKDSKTVPALGVMDVCVFGTLWRDVEINLLGYHSLLNSLVPIAFGTFLGIPEETIRRTLGTFQGVYRRLTPTGFVRGVRFFDDYAHHPTEVQAVLEALGTIQGNGKIFVVLQPHRYSRLGLLMEDFSKAFKGAAGVILLPVYGAGEKPLEGVSSQHLLEKIPETISDKIYIEEEHGSPRVEKIASYLRDRAQEGDIVVCMGAGSITQVAHQLPNFF